MDVAGTDLADTGDAGPFALLDVLDALGMRGATGALVVSLGGDGPEVRVFLRDGEPRLAIGAAAEHAFAAQVVRQGVASPEAVQALEARATREGKRLEVVLLEGRLMARDAIFDLQRALSEFVLGDAIAVGGSWRFDALMPPAVVDQFRAEPLVSIVRWALRPDAAIAPLPGDLELGLGPRFVPWTRALAATSQSALDAASLPAPAATLGEREAHAHLLAAAVIVGALAPVAAPTPVAIPAPVAASAPLAAPAPVAAPAPAPAPEPTAPRSVDLAALPLVPRGQTAAPARELDGLALHLRRLGVSLASPEPEPVAATDLSMAETADVSQLVREVVATSPPPVVLADLAASRITPVSVRAPTPAHGIADNPRGALPPLEVAEVEAPLPARAEAPSVDFHYEPSVAIPPLDPRRTPPDDPVLAAVFFARKKMQSQNPFDALGVRPGTPVSAIREAHTRLRQKWDPSRYSDTPLSPEATEDFTVLRLVVDTAAKDLLDPRLRPRLEKLAGGTLDDLHVNHYFQAERTFHEARQKHKAKELRPAYELMVHAASLNTSEPEYPTWCGAVLWETLLSEKAFDDAGRKAVEYHLTSALAIQPKHEAALVLLGRLQRARGDVVAALRTFHQVLAVNPRSQEARDAVKELEVAVAALPKETLKSIAVETFGSLWKRVRKDRT